MGLLLLLLLWRGFAVDVVVDVLLKIFFYSLFQFFILFFPFLFLLLPSIFLFFSFLPFPFSFSFLFLFGGERTVHVTTGVRNGCGILGFLAGMGWFLIVCWGSGMMWQPMYFSSLFYRPGYVT